MDKNYSHKKNKALSPADSAKEKKPKVSDQPSIENDEDFVAKKIFLDQFLEIVGDKKLVFENLSL